MKVRRDGLLRDEKGVEELVPNVPRGGEDVEVPASQRGLWVLVALRAEHGRDSFCLFTDSRSCRRTTARIGTQNSERTAGCESFLKLM